jgi:hypothetical protein
LSNQQREEETRAESKGRKTSGDQAQKTTPEGRCKHSKSFTIIPKRQEASLAKGCIKT